jgi:hypothetical protein
MEKFLELRAKALEYLKNAEQGARFTYPLVRDNKVLLSVVNNIFMCITCTMGSILYYEMMQKRVPVFTDNFESKYQLMRTHVMERYSFDREYLRLARDLKDIIIAHNKSPIEFSREGKFVICTENYEMKEISLDSVKKALIKTKLFIDEVITVTSSSVR